MSNASPGSAGREVLAAALRVLGVPTDAARLAELEEKAAALLDDGDRVSARVAPDVEPMVVLRLPGSEREGIRQDG